MKRLFLIAIVSLFASLAWAETKEGGIIGTGVVGQITGVDRFEVAGMPFNLPETLVLTGAESAADLQLGMTVVLNTARDGAGWQATTMRRLPVLVGPVTGLGEVMGIKVSGDLPLEGFVTVDGFWSTDGVVATRVELAKPKRAFVRGRYEQDGRIGQLALADSLPNVQTGEIVTAFGTFESDGLRVSEFNLGLFEGILPELILVEGFFDTPNAAGEAALLSAEAVTRAAANLDEQARLCALRGRLDFVEDELSPEIALIVRDFCISAGN